MKKSHTFLTRVVRIMRNMKDSGIEWIGKIPKEWKIVRVKDGFYRKNKKAHQTNPTVLSLARNGVKIRDISTNEGQLAADYSNYNPVDIDDILINPMDLVSGDNCSISRVRGVISPAYVNLRYRQNINPKFYNYYFKIQYWLGAFFAYGSGVSFKNRWTLPFETINKFPLVLLSPDEQKQIADFLDRKCSEIDALRLEIEREIATLKEYKKSIITEAVTKGLNKNVPMKDSGIEWIDKIPKEWEIIRVKDKYYFNTGFTPDTKNPEYYNDEDGYEWVTISDINNGKINSPTISLISRDYVKNNFCKQVPKGCLLYSFKLSIGQTAITDRPLFTNEALASFIPSPNTNIRFLNYSSSLIEFNANTNIYGAKILNQQLINNAYIVFPPLNEQKQIADYLDRKCSKINDIIKSKNKQLSTLDEYKKSLIYEYVTGKKEVPSV